MGLRIIEIGKNPIKKRRKKKRARVIKRRVMKKVRRIKRKKIVRLRKNPPARKKHETMISGLIRTDRRKKFKTVYFTGTGFSRKKDDAKCFAGSAAKHEARRILPILPPQIYSISVERC